MTIKSLFTASFIALSALAIAAPIAAHAKSADMKMLDPDSDGTVSLDEAKAAGDMKFAAMDPDKDGTIDMKEGKGMSKAAFKTADSDKDGTIDKTEYTAMVESAFKKADKDGDGTLDKKELATPAGKRLLAFVQ